MSSALQPASTAQQAARAGRWPSRTTTTSRRSASPQISPDGRWVVFTVAHAHRAGQQHAHRSASRARATRRRRRAASCTTARTSPTRRGPTTAACATRPIGSSGRSTRPNASAVAGRRRRRCPPARCRAPTASGSRSRKDKPQPKTDAGLRERLREAPRGALQGRARSTGRTSSATASRSPRRTCARGRRRSSSIQPAGGGDAKTLVDTDCGRPNIAWHPNGIAARLHRRSRLARRAEVREPGSVDGHDRRQGHAAHRRRLRLRRRRRSRPTARTCRTRARFGTDMIIQQKLNHGGPRRSVHPPVAGGEPINLTANWDLEPGDTQWSPDSRFLYFTAAIGGETICSASPAAGGAGRAGHQGRAPARRPHDRSRVQDHRLHRRPARGAAGRVSRPTSTARNERRLTERPRAHRRRDRVQQGRAAALAELRRHADRRLADVPVRLRRRQGPVSADRHQPRRAARGDRLQLRFQEAVLRRQRLLRARHQLPQLHRLRRRVQVGDVGRVGQEGRRGRRLRHRLRAQALPDRSRSASATPATRTAAS